MTNLKNCLHLKEARRSLRRNQTDAEKKLWQHLRNKQFFGYKFYRQYSIGNSIVDFYCPRLRLSIELDGGQHNQPQQKAADKQRTTYLSSLGIKELRFWNNDVLKNTEGTLLEINRYLNRTPSIPLC